MKTLYRATVVLMFIALAFTDEGGPYTCVDGSTSNAKHRQGACSHHGGVR